MTMSQLRPTLWRTCRVIACQSRLKLLWEIFETDGVPVCGLGQSIHISNQNASIQLRLLNSRGLITPRRAGMEVLYGTEANKEVEHAQDLLDALRECHKQKIPIDRVIGSATAFTHERRIRIVQVLGTSALRPAGIEEKTGIGARALYRHLAKLESRGFIKGTHGMYRLAVPKNPLGKCLLRIVCPDNCGTKRLKISKVISGGQTGADRAALDAAIACGVPHGGWCPKGRRAEDGPIPSTYNLRESDSEEYPVRTKANVEAADLTLIFTRGPLAGGSLLTKQFAEELGKPCVHVDLSESFQGLENRRPVGAADFQALEKLQETFPSIGKIVLNVAGPRASTDSGIYDAVYQAMITLLRGES